MNDWTLVGPNCSAGSKWVTGWYIANSFGSGVAAETGAAVTTETTTAATMATATGTAREMVRIMSRLLLGTPGGAPAAVLALSADFPTTFASAEVTFSRSDLS